MTVLPRAAWPLLLPLALPACQSGGPGLEPLSYPSAREADQVDDYHGTEVRDPYRWLEDLDSPETRAWVEAQNRVTQAYLSNLPRRAEIADQLEEIWDFERSRAPKKHGGRYFTFVNPGLANQPILYVQDSLDAPREVLIDPNALSEDGTIALRDTHFSEDGRYLAFSLQEAGSDWSEYFVLDVETGERLSDHLTWTKFTDAAWTHDGAGFFYSRYPKPEDDAGFEAVTRNQKLYYHFLDRPQSEDVLVFETPEHPEWGFVPIVSQDGRWLLIHGWEGSDRRSRYWHVDLGEAIPGEVRPLLPEFDAAYSFVGTAGGVAYFFTDNDAPRGRVIAVPIEDPGPGNWRTVIPESEDTLREVHYLGGKLVCTYLHDAYSRVSVFELDGTQRYDAALPGIGTVGELSGSWKEPEAFLLFESFNRPPTVYRLDLETGRAEAVITPSLAFDPEDFQTDQVWYTSADGTRVPMFLVYARDLDLEDDHPTLLYGYGGFDIPITPDFGPAELVWLQMGGVYAVANIRGGGEFGKDWHLGGSLANKQNVFDDFIAAAEWLIEEGVTSPEHLAIEGGSNGGLLVGAVLNQRPELFGAAIPRVGVMDMLRFHRFTIGWAWVTDYGSSDDPEQFETLYAYSPLHNIREGADYPATLIVTADHDDRVVPSHSFKYAAALQKAQGGAEPILIRIETRAGHGSGKPTSKRIEEATDRLAFLMYEIGE